MLVSHGDPKQAKFTADLAEPAERACAVPVAAKAALA